MKKIIKYISIAILLGGVSACESPADFLETDPTSWYGENVVYSSVDNMDLYVKGLYGVLYANAEIAKGYVFDDCISDLVKVSWFGTGGGSVNKLFTGTGLTPESNFLSNWSSHYTYIRQLNEFFYDYNYGYISGLDQETVSIRMAEVRFLRAFAYQELIDRFGGVVLRVDEVKVDGPSENDKARSTEAESWEFVISEYAKAAESLPLSWSGDDRGRITKGAALAMAARASLYAGRYDDAISYCDKVFNLNQYTLVDGSTADSYNRIFTEAYNSEIILPVYFAEGTKQHNYNYYFCPPADGNALSVSCGAAATPTDEYASCFDIKVSGKYEDFSWDNLSKYTDGPFANRDNRFYANILYNGATWKGRTLELYVNGKDGYMDYKQTGQDNVHKSTTGYIFRKFMSTSSSINYTSIQSASFWIEMRLAELYLIRSEAYAQKGEWARAYADLNKIRSRAGMPNLTQKSSWESYLTDLSKERVCELGMEGQRFFDLKRWGLLQDKIDGQQAHGIKITKSAESFKYQYVTCDPKPREFPAMYNVYPIPYTEMKNNSLCIQNENY